MPPAPPLPAAGPAPPEVDPRPSWLPADAPWPPASFTASPAVPLTTDVPLSGPAPGAQPWANVYSDVISQSKVGGHSYAGFWIRTVAYIIDSFIVGIPVLVVFVAILQGSGADFSNMSTATANQYVRIFQLLNFAAEFGYFVTFWTLGSTPGMRLVGIRVADASTFETIGAGKAMLRFLGFIVSGVLCGLGFLRVAWNPDKQGLHDRMAGTVVVWRK